MGGVQQPFLYPAEKSDDRFPTVPFDPKAVTRASIEAKPKKKPKRKGPLISFNQHPDSHVVPLQRSVFWKPMSGRTKWWIKAVRVIQLLLRVVQLNGAVGLLVLAILIKDMAELTAWVMRITPAVVAIHCVYAIVHLCRPAGSRTPGSSTAYHTFAILADVCIMPLLGYGALATRNDGDKWKTLLPNQDVLATLLPAYYWTLVGDCCLHFVSLAGSVWLSLTFRRIYKMPPDMNPLENHLTARQHKRNKSSVATTSAYSDAGSRSSVQPDAISERPPQVPFAHTRRGSDVSSARVNLPSRHYQLTPGNSPRNSATEAELNRFSAPVLPAPVPQRQSQQPPSSSFIWGTYTEIPTAGEEENSSSRPGTAHDARSARLSTGTVPSYRASPTPVPAHQVAAQSAQPRAARFTEAWYASDSLVNRTQQRARALNQLGAAGNRPAYEALTQPYDDGSASEDEDHYGSDRENAHYHYTYGGAGRRRSSSLISPDGDDENDHHSDDETDLGNGRHPNPLRSNPMGGNTGNTPPTRTKTPYYPRGYRLSIDRSSAALADIDLNDRRVSGNGLDIADEKLAPASSSKPNYKQQKHLQPQSHLHRNGSIQSESDFYSKPYGELKAATPPVLVGTDRQVSSGNDFSGADARHSMFARRGVSGKMAEEGRVFL